jgi:archaellum component FlaC
MISPPAPETEVPASQGSASSLYSAYDYARAPPPYDSVVASEQPATETPASTPIAVVSHNTRQQSLATQSPLVNAVELYASSSTEQGETSSLPGGRRNRARPPLPVGPRRPSQQFPGVMRERNGSVSSTTPPSIRPSNRSLLPSPKFETPVARFRGFTMDAAKWTFTSTELQAVVSRAIRQSSEGSAIRLLRLETLDNEIPEELERLETQRNDVKHKYKVFTRRRNNVLESLAKSVNGSDPDGPSRAARLVEDLRDVSATLDRLTEELHNLDEQYAQITQLCERHSASALAMALRKLNASFLKQFAETQNLRQRVEALEAERDEAWQQAEAVAVEYDDLRHRVEASPDITEDRFNRVSAVRKSSLRATKAGLRSAGQRSSMGSSRSHSHHAPSISSAIPDDIIPPVPSMPRRRGRRPVDIMTDLPLRRASVVCRPFNRIAEYILTFSKGISTGPTPSSETRAMLRAQDDLYEMLGIVSNDTRSRRSRSVIGIPGEPEQVVSPSYSYYDPPPSTGRRLSLPGSPTQPDTFQAMAADLSIILTSSSSERQQWI